MTEGEQRASRRTWPWWAGFFVVVAIAMRLTYLAYQELLPSPLLNYDKAVHFTIAGTLSFFLDGALERRAFAVRGWKIPVASVTLLAVSGMDELLQRFSVHRTSDIRDFAADVAGIVFFTWLSRRIGARSEARAADAGHDRAE